MLPLSPVLRVTLHFELSVRVSSEWAWRPVQSCVKSQENRECTMMMVKRWNNEQGNYRYLDLEILQRWRIFQKWWRAPHGPIAVADSSCRVALSELNANCRVFPFASRVCHPDTIQWWCLVQLLPLQCDKWQIEPIPDLKFKFVRGEASFVTGLFPRLFWDWDWDQTQNTKI